MFMRLFYNCCFLDASLATRIRFYYSTMTPLPNFRYKRSELNRCLLVPAHNGDKINHDKQNGISELDKLLLCQWNNAMDKGCFRYTLDHVMSRRIPGEQGFVAQFNDKRTTSRRKPHSITHIRQPFDSRKFNFTKIQDGEILFKLSPMLGDGIQEGQHRDDGHFVIINDSPVDVGHVLLVPRLYQELPQVLTEEAIHLALDMMLLSGNRCFRLAWNSLGALASVNHLHFHGIHLNHSIMGERLGASLLNNGCYEIMDQTTRGFAFQLYGQSPASLARSIYLVSSVLMDLDVPHNLCMTWGQLLDNKNIDLANPDKDQLTLRVLLWPKPPMFDLKEDLPFVNACVEPAGFLVIKDLESYRTMTEDRANAILGKFSLPEVHFEKIKNHISRVLTDDAESIGT